MPRQDRFAFFPLYVLDFTADGVVECMETEGVGAYIFLMCKAWRESPAGTLPDDDAILSRWSRLPMKTWLKHKQSVMKAFTLGDDGRWHQKRLKSEHQKIIEKYAKRKSAGSKGAETRWQKDSNAIGLPSFCYGESESDLKPPNPLTESNGSSGRSKWGITKSEIQTDAAALRWLTDHGAAHGLPDNHETRALVLAARIQVETSREIENPAAAFVGLLKGIASGKRDAIGDDNLTAGKRHLRDHEKTTGQNGNAGDGFTELAKRIAGEQVG